MGSEVCNVSEYSHSKKMHGLGGPELKKMRCYMIYGRRWQNISRFVSSETQCRVAWQTVTAVSEEASFSKMSLFNDRNSIASHNKCIFVNNSNLETSLVRELPWNHKY